MSFRYVRHRKDTTQDAIVEALEKAGYTVERDGEVDLVVRHSTWMSNVWMKLECKSKNRKLGFVPRSDQKDQADYCASHGIPYALTPEQALSYLQLRGLKLLEALL